MGIGSFVSDTLGSITGSTAAAESSIEGSKLSSAATLEATEKNIDFQKWLWGEQKELSQPYADMGSGAISQYQDALSKPLTMEDLYNEPGYQFGFQEGQRGVETSGSARGMQLSGRQAKDLTRFGTDYASTKYNEAFNRRQVNLDNLYRMINSGQAAASGQAAQGGQMGAQVSGSIMQAGQATSQMYSDIGNIQAGQAMSGFNTLMDVGKLGASFT